MVIILNKKSNPTKVSMMARKVMDDDDEDEDEYIDEEEEDDDGIPEIRSDLDSDETKPKTLKIKVTKIK